MKKSLGVVTIVLALLVGVQSTARAKPDLAMARIIGPDRIRSVELTDVDALYILNPWGAKFADWEDGLVESPPPLERTYQVWLYIPSEGPETQLEAIYLFYYHPNFEGGEGLVYVPGPGEHFYTRNVATIIDGREGEWHPASPQLDEALRPLIANFPQELSGEGKAAMFSNTVLVTFSVLVTLFLVVYFLAKRSEPDFVSA